MEKNLTHRLTNEFIAAMKEASVHKFGPTVSSDEVGVKNAMYGPVEMLASKMKLLTDEYIEAINDLYNIKLNANTMDALEEKLALKADKHKVIYDITNPSILTYGYPLGMISGTTTGIPLEANTSYEVLIEFGAVSVTAFMYTSTDAIVMMYSYGYSYSGAFNAGNLKYTGGQLLFEKVVIQKLDGIISDLTGVNNIKVIKITKRG